MPKQNPSSPRSVIGKVCAILAQFTLETPTLSLDEIAQGSGVARTSTHRILHSLMDEGYVTLTAQGYRLGLRLFQIGIVAQQTLRLEELFDEVLQPLAQEIQETLIVATLAGEDILYLHVIQSSNPLRFVAGVGQRRDARFGATGLVLLSSLDKGTRQTFVTDPLPSYTAKTVTDSAMWLERLEQIAKDGIALERGEFFDGIEAIAVPIKNSQPLALTIVGPEERMRPKEAAIISGLQAAASQLEKFSLF